MRQGLLVASSNVLPTPPFISFFSMMKSTLSLKAGMISTMEVRAGEPERFTLVENIGPVRGRRAERKGSSGTLTARVSPCAVGRITVKGAGQREAISSGTTRPSLSRSLMKLQKEGYIEIYKSKARILDYEGLERICYK